MCNQVRFTRTTAPSSTWTESQCVWSLIIFPSSIQYRRTMNGGARASRNGRRSPSPFPCFAATISHIFQVNSASTIFAIQRRFIGRRHWPVDTVSRDFAFIIIGFTERRSLDEPLRVLLENPDIDIGFCLNWANETWSRRWDAGAEDVLIAQDHSPRRRHCPGYVS